MEYTYSNLVFFIFISLLFTIFLVYLGDKSSTSLRDSEKYSSYECGFQPFDIVIPNFQIKYYLVALLFLIFDVEIVILIPFITCINIINFWQFIFFITFYVILLLALFFEWSKSYLDWR